MTGLQAERSTLIQSGYEAPVRKSLVDPHQILSCPKLALLGFSFICGLLYLRWLPGVWWMRLGLVGVIWLAGVAGMVRLTRADPQWLEVGWQSAQRTGRLEV